jgi:hypothetical protein
METAFTPRGSVRMANGPCIFMKAVVLVDARYGNIGQAPKIEPPVNP